MKSLARVIRGAAGISILILVWQAELVAADEMGDRSLWSSGDQFVRLVSQEPGAELANEHPQKLNGDRLAAALTALEVYRPGFDKRDHQALFDEQAASLLAAKLAEALAAAGPAQDVVFAIITSRPAGLLGKHQSSVSARVFVVDGRLNLIFGDLLRSTLPPDFHSDPNRSRTIDRRLHPHRPGSRHKPVDAEYRLHVTERMSAGGQPNWISLDLANLPALPVVEASASDASRLKQQLQMLRSLREDGLLDEQSYRDLVKEAVSREMLE